MIKDIEAIRLRAEASFMTPVSSAEPMTVEDAMLHAVQEKTARLRTLRLDKEQADREAAVATVKPQKRAK